MPDLPSSLALTTIQSNAQILSADHRNNYTAIQTAVNALIAALSGGTAGQVLRATDSDTIGFASVPTTYRKTTAKTVNSTVAETDLLNGEITVAANAIGATGRLRFHARGDWLQNSGGASGPPRLRLKLGATTLIDTGAGNAVGVANSATRFGWQIDADIFNSATNAQWVTFRSVFSMFPIATGSNNSPATGEGQYWSAATSGGNALEYLSVIANSGAVDTTSANALVLSTVNASSSASYEVVLKNALVVIE